ncbi:MAG: hypothetical protein GW886_12970 [Rhodobacterales bacterium]|nr:hypothetical protein [Rhodobacterales bacterium]NCT12606.1 hypothetical protein [Rhodobacterales bacterium]
MHLLAFLVGSLVVAGIVLVVALWAGFGGWAAVGMCVGALVLAQGLYVITVALLARAEGRAGPAPDTTGENGRSRPTKTTASGSPH